MKQFIGALCVTFMLAAVSMPTVAAAPQLPVTTVAAFDSRHSPSVMEQTFELFSDQQSSYAMIAIVAIAFGCGVPLLIVFVIFFFRHKSKQAQYRLAEQAIASGQPLPPDFFRRADTEKSMFNKGIGNVFTGIGLFIFLWAITGDFGVGSIGLLVMFMGFGQLVIFYLGQKKNEPLG
ncbi:MAG: DUF6249 domain-containing protein [Prevotellaceae bacterium]|jgi:hypothetical protein|nr:DUF6249 domain-containing protein [Prevotellaceae bacterium]